MMHLQTFEGIQRHNGALKEIPTRVWLLECFPVMFHILMYDNDSNYNSAGAAGMPEFSCTAKYRVN